MFRSLRDDARAVGQNLGNNGEIHGKPPPLVLFPHPTLVRSGAQLESCAAAGVGTGTTARELSPIPVVGGINFRSPATPISLGGWQFGQTGTAGSEQQYQVSHPIMTTIEQ